MLEAEIHIPSPWTPLVDDDVVPRLHVNVLRVHCVIKRVHQRKRCVHHEADPLGGVEELPVAFELRVRLLWWVFICEIN
jgi:hypothetical protein